MGNLGLNLLFLSLSIIAFMSILTKKQNLFFLSKYLSTNHQDLWGIAVNVNNLFELFATHSFTNSTLYTIAESCCLCMVTSIG